MRACICMCIHACVHCMYTCACTYVQYVCLHMHVSTYCAYAVSIACLFFIMYCSANWCDHWFEYFPNPPLNILAMVENVLAYHDHRLLEHFVQYGITSQVIKWFLYNILYILYVCAYVHKYAPCTCTYICRCCTYVHTDTSCMYIRTYIHTYIRTLTASMRTVCTCTH